MQFIRIEDQPLRGTNPARPPLQGDGSILEIKRIFATIQGEGPYAGIPAVFVRLGGCNLSCSFCDTNFEDFDTMELGSIVGEVRRLADDEATNRVRKLVVITGGEPLRQPIAPLCEALLGSGFIVQIETNGTIWRELPEGVSVVCSPKPVNGKYAPLRPDLLARVAAVKFLISASVEGYGDVAEVGQSETGVPVYVQVMDEYDEVKNAQNLALAMHIAQARGYRLSIQMHKLLRIE